MVIVNMNKLTEREECAQETPRLHYTAKIVDIYNLVELHNIEVI